VALFEVFGQQVKQTGPRVDAERPPRQPPGRAMRQGVRANQSRTVH
jgi:hypothetical protein